MKVIKFLQPFLRLVSKNEDETEIRFVIKDEESTKDLMLISSGYDVVNNKWVLTFREMEGDDVHGI